MELMNHFDLARGDESCPPISQEREPCDLSISWFHFFSQ